MVSREKINADNKGFDGSVSRRFHVAHFYRLHGEIVERWFSLQTQNL